MDRPLAPETAGVTDVQRSGEDLVSGDGVTKHARDFAMMTGMSLEDYRMPARTRNPRRGQTREVLQHW